MDKAKLRDIPLFSKLNDDELQTVATFADERSVSDGDVLVREGDFSFDLMVIQEGTAEVRRGEEVVATLGPGDFFGESGVVNHSLRSATVAATSSMRLITLDSFDVKRLRKMGSAMETIEEAIAARSAS